MTTVLEDLQEKFPFLSCLKHGDIEYVGIIINQDSNVTSMYDYSSCNNDAQKLQLLECGDSWWWESNRKIPINIFMKTDMIQFRSLIKTFATKDVELVFGPMVRLNDITEKRIKRKSIQLVRKIK
jgi:hypothetical protein